MITGWLNRYALRGVDTAEAFYGFLLSAAFFLVLYLIAHFVDRRKKSR
jgi:hypothetical protein